MDVTDATFQDDVVTRSAEVPVVVDLWAPWCGPCTTLGPMLERAVAATDGAVGIWPKSTWMRKLRGSPRTFGVKSIPAVFAIAGGQVVDQFIGALPEEQVTAFVSKLLPAPSEADQLVAVGDESSLRQALALEAGHPAATEALARILIDRGEPDEALALLAKVIETPATRALAAEARLLESGVDQVAATEAVLRSRPDSNALLRGWCGMTRPPGRNSSTCSRHWVRKTLAPTRSAAPWRPASSDGRFAGRFHATPRRPGATRQPSRRHLTPCDSYLHSHLHSDRHRSRARPRRPPPRPDPPGPRHGHPQPHARLLLRQRGSPTQPRCPLPTGRRAGGRRRRHRGYRRGQGRSRSRRDGARGDGAGGPGGRAAWYERFDVPVSVDTWRASVARALLRGGRPDGQ